MGIFGVTAMLEKAWWQDLMTPGHTVSALRKQREMNTGVPLAFPLFSVQNPSPCNWYHQELGWVFPPCLCCSFTVIKHNNQNQPQEDRAYLILHFLITATPLKESEAGTPSRNWSRNWRNAAYLLAPWWLSQIIFLYNWSPSAKVWHHPQWARSFHINHYF